MNLLVILTTVTLMACVSVQAQVNNDPAYKKNRDLKNKALMKKEIPASLKAEHKELHENLEKFTRMPGKTGMAAKEVAKQLHPHFIKEEEFALPPLGYLPELAKGTSIDKIEEVVAMSDKLKQDWQQMLSEHQQILGSLVKLRKAAQDEQHPDVVRFTESLELHAKTEEEVLYPTAILIGEYLKLKKPTH
jgi:hypothetical protein